jgi:hypothetical protein
MRIVFTVLAGLSWRFRPASLRDLPLRPIRWRRMSPRRKRLAGQDLKALLTLCEPAPATRAAQDAIDRLVSQQIARTPPEPGRAFDDLYYVGAAWASAWALKTTDGVILIATRSTTRRKPPRCWNPACARWA